MRFRRRPKSNPIPAVPNNGAEGGNGTLETPFPAHVGLPGREYPVFNKYSNQQVTVCFLGDTKVNQPGFGGTADIAQCERRFERRIAMRRTGGDRAHRFDERFQTKEDIPPIHKGMREITRERFQLF